MDGMNANFPGHLTGNVNMLQQMNNYNNIQNIPNASTQPANNLINNNNNTTELNPKRQAVFDRLKKRMNLYRKRQNESIPRFDQTFSGICEQQSVETNVLQKRFVESKAKRVAKKADKKQTDVVPNNVTVSQTKQIKRPAVEDLDDSHQPAAKMPSTGTSNAIDNMKFQVEIVQQLEFTTSVANLQPQQISTNVTVKTMANGSLKYEPQEIKTQKMEPIKMQSIDPPPISATDILQDFKQEPDNEFADLDFGGLANFMANDENELNKLFSNISEVFDQDLFDQDKIKQEPRPLQNIPQMQHLNQMSQLNQQFNQYGMPESCQMQKPMIQQQQSQLHRMYQSQQVPNNIPEMSPAAQTLKNMAQQHQVKSSMAMNYMRPVGQSMVQQMNQHQQTQQQPVMPQRLPYQQQGQQQPFNDYNGQFHKNQIQMPFPPEMIKQEIMMQQQPQMSPMQMKPIMNHQMMVHQNEDIKMNQQYQQYQNTQFLPSHQQQPQRSTFNPNQNTMNIHMKQTQMMHIQQGNSGGNIQMQGGQHMNFAGDMKMTESGNFTMQQQQNMYFNHHTHQPNTHPQYGNIPTMQKRPQHHQQPMGSGEGSTNSYNMMQSQSMSFTQ